MLLRLGKLVLGSVLDPPRDSLLLFLGGGLLARPGSLGQLVPDSVFDPPGARSMVVAFAHTLCLLRIAPLSGRHVLFGTYNSERCRRASGVSNSWEPLYATYRAFLLMKAQSLVTDRLFLCKAGRCVSTTLCPTLFSAILRYSYERNL